MKKIFFGLILNLLLVINLQAATYYSSALGYWCLARNGKSFCFRNIPTHNSEDIFIVDREIKLNGDAKILGSLIIEENGSLNVSGNLELQGKLEILFAGVLNVNSNLLIGETADVNVDRYGAIHVKDGFINAFFSEDVLIDGLLEVMGKFENQGIIKGLGKIIAPGECISFPDAMTFNQPGCEGINVFNLPVSLINFEAKPVKNKIILSWKTTQENNVDFFRLERASETKSFEAIGTILSENKEDGIQSYSYIDDNPLKGNNIYRLVSVDKSGSIDYLQVTMIRFVPGGTAQFSIYPNPVAGGKIYISLGFIPEKEGVVSVFNMQGKLAHKLNFTSANQSIEFENELEPGFYVVYLESNGLRIKQRLIVK